MKIKILKEDFSVMKLKTLPESIPPFSFLSLTDEEISFVCPSKAAPEDYIENEPGWKGFRIEGALDFSLIGVIAKISKIIAENGIGIFVCSTYNTDYIFVKSAEFERALSALKYAGYEIYGK